MTNLHQDLLDAQETILDLQKRITELETENAALKKENLELQSGESNSTLPVSIDMHLDRPFNSRD